MSISLCPHISEKTGQQARRSAVKMLSANVLHITRDAAIPIRIIARPMQEASPSFRSHLTLVLTTTILHAFTHAYAVLLVPLYLLVRRDFHLELVSSVSLIVTLYGLVYSLGSYAAGAMSDRFNRKALLGIGLLGNALAITCMGLTRQYDMLIALGVMAGLFGTMFHPAGNSLVPRISALTRDGDRNSWHGVGAGVFHRATVCGVAGRECDGVGRDFAVAETVRGTWGRGACRWDCLFDSARVVGSRT